MSDWQPIETAPVGKRVMLGRWYMGWEGKPVWQEEIDVAYERGFFGFGKTATYDGRKYTHWKWPPPPPTTRETA